MPKAGKKRKDNDMKAYDTIMNNEEGSVIILTLIVLALLTVIGISSTTTSTIELQITRNERLFNQNFYLTEAAIMEAIQRVKNETNQSVLNGLSENWLHNTKNIMDDPGNWVRSGASTNSELSSYDTGNNELYYSVVNLGRMAGSSLDPTKGQSIREYTIFALYDSDSVTRSGQILIEVGFKR
jgi:hypothetical protein